MAYEPKNYEKLLGTAGFSDTLLNNHFTLYKGYVTNTNKSGDILGAMLKEDKTATPEYAEMKRRSLRNSALLKPAERTLRQSEPCAALAGQYYIMT
jgi:hypothetical protein